VVDPEEDGKRKTKIGEEMAGEVAEAVDGIEEDIEADLIGTEAGMECITSSCETFSNYSNGCSCKLEFEP
jgi:hypothetical protein